jgi:ACT domain-containing protein
MPGPRPETMEKFNKTKELLASGECKNLAEALKKTGLNPKAWYSLKKTIKRPYNKKKHQTFIDVPMQAHVGSKVTVIVCDLEQVKNVVENLR